jgi:2-dehydropantoate 2-reductase
MKLLVIGAGPIGSLYAARLALAGHEIELVAKARRLDEIDSGGLRIVDAATGFEDAPPVRLSEAGDPEASYDAAIVAVRSERLAAALPELAALRGARCLVTMANQSDGGKAAAAYLGPDKLVLGFPGATASVRPDGAVVYGIAPSFAQRTTFGEAAGGVSERALALAAACAGAGFPSATSADMPAWLRTHAAFIGPVGVALAFMADGSPAALVSDRAALSLMVDGIREGLVALAASGSRIEPGRLDMLARAPRGLVIAAARALLGLRSFADVLGGHATVSRDEMRVLVGASLERARSKGLPSAALETLLGELGKNAPSV